jgi:hypothetical protein
MLGFLAVFVAIPSGNLSIISNILCFINIDYLAFYKSYGQASINGLFAAGAIIGAFAYLRIQYTASQKTGVALN